METNPSDLLQTSHDPIIFDQAVKRLISAVILQAARDVNTAPDPEMRLEAGDFLLTDGFFLGRGLNLSQPERLLDWALSGCPGIIKRGRPAAFRWKEILQNA